MYPKEKGVIAPEIYGHFTEHIGGVFYDGLWGGKNSDIPDAKDFGRVIIDKLRTIKAPVMRWPGDKEGRALLAFVCHYKINKKQVPCMKLMIDKIPEMSNGRMFFGPDPSEVLFEQQLSGHSWYLRGLCEYYEQFNDQRALEYLNKTFEKLYLPTMGRFEGYPIDRPESSGGVSGHSVTRLTAGSFLPTSAALL